jgi:hypothetical protein
MQSFLYHLKKFNACFEGGGAEIQRAFLFACYTGLRVSDLQAAPPPPQKSGETRSPARAPSRDGVKSVEIRAGKSKGRRSMSCEQ